MSIGTDHRYKYVWVVLNIRGLYTVNPDDMAPLEQYAQKKDNTCDVCGAHCTEVLHRMRCYLRVPDPPPLATDTGGT